MANDVKLGESHPLDEHLRPLKVNNKASAIETAQTGDGCRVNGDLEVTGKMVNLKTKAISAVELDSDLIIRGNHDVYIHAGEDGSGSLIIKTGDNVYGYSGAYLTLDIDLDGSGGAGCSIKLLSMINNNDYCLIDTTTNGVTTISTVDADAVLAHLTLDAAGDITLDAAGNIELISGSTITCDSSIALEQGKYIYFDSADTKIGSNADNPEDMLIEADQDILMSPDASLVVDAGAGITLDSATGVFIMKGAGTTSEFSVANSAYAGMILGYTTIGIDAADDSYAVTTAFVTISADHKVKFVAPPSGAVEIEVFIYADCASGGRPLRFGLSDNATYSPIDFPNSDDVTNQHEVMTGDESDEIYISHKWVITGLTAGTAYEWWLGAACSHNFVFALRWGGNVSAEYAPFIMKATALPTATADFAVYG